VVIEQWRQAYNAERPHSSLGYQTPTEYRNLSQPVDEYLGS
ncbi:MAG: integrase core domain-containing protein, partial [Herpetosiphon sp.]|nr:integrase core domain-containing protein [Herpetosiphon sp.]